ncbi:MAG: hypothetical protein AAF518_21790, partial [Spirochaetota bacterium]
TGGFLVKFIKPDKPIRFTKQVILFLMAHLLLGIGSCGTTIELDDFFIGSLQKGGGIGFSLGLLILSGILFYKSMQKQKVDSQQEENAESVKGRTICHACGAINQANASQCKYCGVYL